MSKYLDTGKARIYTDIKQLESNIISDELKKELIQEMNDEVKKKIEYEDFGFKPFQVDDYK